MYYSSSEAGRSLTIDVVVVGILVVKEVLADFVHSSDDAAMPNVETIRPFTQTYTHIYICMDILTAVVLTYKYLYT